MSRQNLAQGGGHPWVAHGCLDGAAGFATDAMQLFGPAYRDDGADRRRGATCRACGCSTRSPARRSSRAPSTLDAGRDGDAGPSSACTSPTTRTRRATPTSRGSTRSRTRAGDFAPRRVALCRAGAQPPAGRAAGGRATPLDDADDRRAAIRSAATRSAATARCSPSSSPDGAPQPPRRAARQGTAGAAPPRHASCAAAQGMLLDETTLCATCWMHGVFAAQLTIGNTSFHKLFSVVARSLQHHPRQRAAHPRRHAAPAGGCSPCPRPSRWASATAAGSTASTTARSPCVRSRPATIRRCSGGSRSTARPAASSSSATSCSASASSSHAGRIEIDAGAQAHRLPPGPGLALGPALSRCRLPSRHRHARRDRGDRRRRTALRRRPAARRRLRRAADPRRPTRFGFAVVGSMTDAAAAERLADAVCAAASTTPAMLAPAGALLGARHPRPAARRATATASRRSTRSSRGSRTTR